MDFKRHSHGGYNYTPRANNNIGSFTGTFQTIPNFSHSQHPSTTRGFRPNDVNNGRVNNLALTHSFKNLLKLHSDMVNERLLCFQTLSQNREYMLNRIISLFRDFLKNDILDLLVDQAMLRVEKKATTNAVCSIDHEENFVSCSGEEYEQNPVKSGPVCLSESAEPELVTRVNFQKQEIERQVVEETHICATREQSVMETMFARERRMEKEFMEFFSDAERQIIDYEKKLRSDNYSQMLTRLRNAEREISYRDQKILQLEDNLKIVNDRCEKVMAELQQVNADHQFEKLQLYHHVEVCKANAKSLAIEELVRWCKWKRCACGRDYETDLMLREFELNFSNTYANNIQELCPIRSLCKDAKDREIDTVNFSWNLPTYVNLMAPALPIPTGSFVPSEEAGTKGIVTNDLRDRYDELQLKAAVMPNYEEVRTMIMKIVCHFKVGGLRVCEEIGGKKFVSSLFYCNEEDLLPSKSGKVFSSGYGDTPEEATERSIKRAFDEIQRMETMNVTNGGMEMTFVRRNPMDSKIGKFDNEPVRMTLLKSYSCDRSDQACESTVCLQEAFLYHNNLNHEDKYMVDWKLHIRIQDKDCDGIMNKLQNVLSTCKDYHAYNFLGKSCK